MNPRRKSGDGMQPWVFYKTHISVSFRINPFMIKPYLIYRHIAWRNP